jgi:hypothetical protein
MPAVFDLADPKPNAALGGMHRRPNATVFVTGATKLHANPAEARGPFAVDERRQVNNSSAGA